MDPTSVRELLKEVRRAAPSVAWSVLAAIGLMLWGPEVVRAGLGLDPLIDASRQYLGIAWLLILVVGLTPLWQMIGVAWRQVQPWLVERLTVYVGKRQLRDLTLGEKTVLRGFVTNNHKTRRLSETSGAVIGLLDEQIIYRSGQPGAETGWFDHNIQLWAWEHLKEHPELLDPAPPRQPPQLAVRQVISY